MGFEEAKTDFYPEKYGEYFASMSPLASKIYWDVQSAITDNQTHLSYSGKCVVIDKKLIYDPIHFSKDSHEGNHETHVFYDDPVLDQDHLSSLLLNIHPKKSDKHVYEESAHWIDEHAVPYSSCTEAQAKACGLSQMVQKIHQNTYVRPAASTKKYKAPSKPPAQPVKKDVEEHNTKMMKNDRIKTGESKEDERGLIKKPEGIIGVSVMGIVSAPPKIEKSKETEDRSKMKEQEAADNLPQQVQNQNLIAELQAKLKKNREVSHTEQSSSPKPCSSIQKSLHKPKAPPPPPPVSAVVTKQPESKLNNKQKTTEDEFIVDVSSPCKIATPKTGFDFLDNW